MIDKGEELDKIMDSFPDAVSLTYGRTDGGIDEDPEVVPERVVAAFSFSEKGFDFGEVTIVRTKAGCFIDTERMSRERVKRYLCALVDGAVTDADEEPEKHRLYNQEMGRSCSEHCRICYPDGVTPR